MRNHPAHASPRRDLRNRRRALAPRPICSRPDPIRWSESGRTPIVAGGQGRPASDLSATAADLIRVVLAGVALAVLTYGLGGCGEGLPVTTSADRPFAARVDDALRQAALVLSDGALAAAEVAKLGEQLRRFREQVVEPEAARTVTAERPIALAMSVTEAEAHAAVCGAASRGAVVIAPTAVQAAALGVLSLRLRSQIDQHAARPVGVPPAADAALANDAGGAA